MHIYQAHKSQPMNNFVWDKIPRDPKHFKDFIFSEEIGKILINGSLDSPIHIFNNFFTDSVFLLILEETNKYAKQRELNLDLELGELKAFLGILLIMGFQHLPSIKSYWSTDENFHISRVSNDTKKISTNTSKFTS